MDNATTAHRAANVALRVVSLAAKLALTLYMGRFLGLEELGVYGLVFSSVMIATGVLGSRLDYVVSREIVAAEPLPVAKHLRDQFVLNLLQYALFALVCLAALSLDFAPPQLIGAVFVIAVLEHLANSATTNLVPLGKPVLSTFLFFVRAGLWALVVVALGLLFPALRTIDVVLAGWIAGSALGVVMGLWALRDQPWRQAFAAPIDWAWLRRGVKTSFPIWVGTIAAMTASGMDRFVVSYFLDLEKVGIITFYGSFAAALFSLVHSGFFSFAYPRLIGLHKQGAHAAFWAEIKKTARHVSLFVFSVASFLAIALPVVAELFHKPEIAAEEFALVLILIGVWIRSHAETYYFALYAQHRDRPLWMGDMGYLAMIAVFNVVFVPLWALKGVGVSAILASIALTFWWHRAAHREEGGVGVKMPKK